MINIVVDWHGLTKEINMKLVLEMCVKKTFTRVKLVKISNITLANKINILDKIQTHKYLGTTNKIRYKVHKWRRKQEKKIINKLDDYWK